MKVLGDGPLDADIIFVGEAPGEVEERRGIPFCNERGAGGEFDKRYLPSIGLKRADVRVTNLVRYRPPHNADPEPWMIERDEPELQKELYLVKPKYVVTLGRISAWWMLRADFPPNPKKKELWSEFSMEMHHSLPHPFCYRCHSQKGIVLPVAFDHCTLCGRGDAVATLMPLYHPAAGLHSSDMQNFIQLGFDNLRLVLDGKLDPPRDEYLRPQYEVITDAAGGPIIIERMFPDDGEELYVDVDTEGWPGNVWSIQFSIEPGTGYLIQATEKKSLAALAKVLARPYVITSVHNSPHDLLTLPELGIHPSRIYDNMVASYLLKLYPQGLKPLSYRIAGMKMQSYEDLMELADRKLAVEYLQQVISHRCLKCRGTAIVLVQGKTKKKEAKCPECSDGTAWPSPKPQLVRENGKLREYCPQPIGKLVGRILSDLEGGKDVNPRERWQKLDPAVRMPVESLLGLMPEPTLDDVPFEEAVRYACRDADATNRDRPVLLRKVSELGMDRVLEMDMAIIPMIVEMEQVGWKVRPQHFHDLTKQFTAEMKECEQAIREIAGHYVNPASSKQVAELLFVELGLPPVKQTKSRAGESTDDKVLEALKIKTHHPVIDHLTRYRELDKLVGTYTSTLPTMVDANNRIHAKFRITRTESGRLSSFDPNLQNIPSRSKDGKLVRAGFVAEEGMVLSAWDLDQIEMRVLAHESEDPNLVKLFIEGDRCQIRRSQGKCKCHDIHLLTASLIYRIPIDQVTDEQRTLAKNIGFGIVYGITAKGLKAQMDVRGQERSLDECQEMIDAYLTRAYPGVAQYMDRMAAQARQSGYVADMFGRVRYLAAVHSVVEHVAAEALRIAGNHPIQAGAQGVIKLAMAKLQHDTTPKLRKRGYRMRWLLQEHDALVCEHEEGMYELIDPLVRKAMANAVQLRVPVSSKGSTGMTWLEAKG